MDRRKNHPTAYFVSAQLWLGVECEGLRLCMGGANRYYYGLSIAGSGPIVEGRAVFEGL